MPHPSQNQENRDPVQDMAADFEACARRAIECLLNRPTLLSKPFGPRTRPAEEPCIRCFIESGNPDQAFVVSLGISETGLRSLFPDEKDGEMGLDAIGEMVNIIAGTLFGRPVFRSRYGCLRATVPSFSAPGLDMGAAGIVRGVLLVGAARLTLELAVIPGIRGGNE